MTKTQRTTPQDRMIGARVRTARRLRRLTALELGQRLIPPMGKNQLGKYERGENRLSASMVVAIADALQISLDYLVYGDRGVQ